MASLTPSEMTARCQPIELLVADVDGVLTDGVIAVTTTESRPSTFMCVTDWRSGYGTGLANRRRFYQAAEPKPSIAALPSSGLPTSFKDTTRRPRRFMR